MTEKEIKELTEKEMNKYVSRHKVKQIEKPKERLTIVFNYDEKEGRTHIAYPVRFVAVCEDGEIRPVILRYGKFEVVDFASESVSGVFSDNDMRIMQKKCNHRFFFCD